MKSVDNEQGTSKLVWEIINYLYYFIFLTP